MPELYDMLLELRQMIDDGEITFDSCEHQDPPNPDGNYCPICFVLNLTNNVSDDENGLYEETTDAQREEIQRLWERYCNEDQEYESSG